MKKLCLAAAALLFSAACGAKSITVEVTNPSNFDRMEELVEIDAALLPSGAGMVVWESDTLASQVTYDGKLIFRPALRAGETKRFTITAGVVPAFEPRTFGRAYPERYDDLAWENDRVAFRIYGPALEPVDGPSNGIDAWYKRTDKLILDEWYAGDIAGRASYHTDRGEGLDDFKVGRTLGAGAMAPYADGRLWLNGNYASAELLEQGPLRVTFRLRYNDVEVDGAKYSETRTVSLDAGSQMTRVVQEYGFTEPTPVAAGWPLREGEAVETANGPGWLRYSEPATALAGGVTLGLVFPPGRFFTIVEESGGRPFAPHLLAVTNYIPGTPVTYYTGYGWAKAGMDRDAFTHWMMLFSRALGEPLKVSIL